LGYKNNITVTPGNGYTVVVGRGGAGGHDIYPARGQAGAGAAGAVRIVWPGCSRQFPSTCVGSP
jgi:hypothetical protein